MNMYKYIPKSLGHVETCRNRSNMSSEGVRGQLNEIQDIRARLVIWTRTKITDAWHWPPMGRRICAGPLGLKMGGWRCQILGELAMTRWQDEVIWFDGSQPTTTILGEYISISHYYYKVPLGYHSATWLLTHRHLVGLIPEKPQEVKHHIVTARINCGSWGW